MNLRVLLMLTVIAWILPVAPCRAGTQDGIKIALHLKAHSSKTGGRCSTWDTPCSEFTTNGTVGVPYDAYLVVAGGDAELGLTGLSCGLDYAGQVGHGVDVYSWVFCGGLEFPSGEDDPSWPEAGAGNRMTWSCQQTQVAGYESEGLHVLVGAFYLSAYSNDVFAVTTNREVSAEGEFRVVDCHINGTDLDESTAAGTLHFTHEGSNRGYNPCTGVGDPPPDPEDPPPPPPDPDPRPVPETAQPAAFMFHVADTVDPHVVCDSAPLRNTDLVTMGASGQGGNSAYYVYVLGTPSTHYEPSGGGGESLVNDGLRAFRFGIDYQGSQESGGPLRVLSWSSCRTNEGPSDSWPEPQSGILLILNSCEPAEVTPFGYFYVAAYAPATMAFTGFPSTGKVEYATCKSAEVFDPVDPVQVGWVALHGGSIGLDTDGCNPAVEPCTSGPVPAQPMTWGKLKSRYRTDPQ